ncbi:endonuclease [Marivirga arenosa]|uniref:Endonuclease n=1 Tax=Marivirga arenosa TaxID=3059076 RepID=A0AA52F0F9_9BACT|nr:endonuclease [Marivirga sp. BKB1-2]WNB18203.1 endonuclease [Marivirga sp. BKB1-2]
MKKILLLTILSILSTIVIAQPDGYYDGTEGLSGNELKIKLHQILRGHEVKTYSEFRDVILRDLDEDPNTPDNIILFYKNASIPKANFASNNEPDFWNREHTWPSSHGFSTQDTAYTDVHNLRPSDATVNSSKSNKDFNDVENIPENAEGEAPDTYTTNDFWDPRDEIKGDVARILFYMATRYESESLDLELVDRISFSNEPALGVLFTLIKWHEQDPVDAEERARHEGAFGYQGNRNPFIDHPEWVNAIWGGSTSPNLILNTLNFNADFGNAELGSSLEQQYEINAYNLTSDVSVQVEAPFYLSTDGENYTDSIGFSSNNSSEQTFTVFLRFEPNQEEQEVNIEVIHSTDGDSEELSVSGKEGAIEITTIAEAREFTLGEVVTVQGVVIDAGNNSSNNRVIYDGTAGLVVRSFDTDNESENLQQGDSVSVTGGLSEFNNLLQISESPITITILKQGVSLPEPKVISLANVGEEYESQLITVKNVEFVETGIFLGGGASGNFTITDGVNELIFRIGSGNHPIVGEDIPTGLYDVTGFVGQFGNDYQISPRTIDDLQPVEDSTGQTLANIDFKTIDGLIYPNPAKDQIFIKTEKLQFASTISATIYSSNGSKLQELNNINASRNTISIDHLKGGMYFIILSIDDRYFIQKLIKE